MTKELLINKTLGEIRIALLENGEILDYLVTRETLDLRRRVVTGNIYCGKIIRVLPGMQSAFIDIGYSKAAFLHVAEAYLPTLKEQRKTVQKLKHTPLKRSSSKGAVTPDELSTIRESVEASFRRDIKIETLLKEGGTVLVQVAKEAISTKGPRVTRQITLAGRYIVYMPFVEHIGVSRRIVSERERNRLDEILRKISPGGIGLIARTVAEGQDAETLRSDYEMLAHIWREVQKKTPKAKPKQLIYAELSFVEKTLRDIAGDDIDFIHVDDHDTFKAVEKFTRKYLPTMKGKIKYFDQSIPIFEHFEVDIEIERAISSKVYLRSGGSINIDQTEALVSVDVNTGKFVGKKTFAETVLKTNLEAVKEIAYQLRIRNCGGIIVIDFIDMEKEEHREQVYHSLLEAFKRDRAKTSVLAISGLGLVEMTRKRTQDTLTRIMCNPCPYCEGSGRVKSTLTICYEIIREVTKMLKKHQVDKIFLYAHPEVSAKLCSDETDIIELVEQRYGKAIIIRAENSYHLEQYELH